MSRWATLVDIAGVSFTGCRAVVVDGHGFLSNYAGSIDWANDFQGHTQVFNRGVKGVPFGIQMLSTQITALQNMITAVKTAQASNATFRVKITEGMFTIDVMAVPDYSGQSWVTFGKHSEGWVEDVLVRFVARAAGA